MRYIPVTIHLIKIYTVIFAKDMMWTFYNPLFVLHIETKLSVKILAVYYIYVKLNNISCCYVLWSTGLEFC